MELEAQTEITDNEDETYNTCVIKSDYNIKSRTSSHFNKKFSDQSESIWLSEKNTEISLSVHSDAEKILVQFSLRLLSNDDLRVFFKDLSFVSSESDEIIIQPDSREWDETSAVFNDEITFNKKNATSISDFAAVDSDCSSFSTKETLSSSDEQAAIIDRESCAESSVEKDWLYWIKKMLKIAWKSRCMCDESQSIHLVHQPSNE